MGRGRYVTDVELPRMLHVAFVRSPHAHARIRGIDTAAARAADGVAAVATGADADWAPHRIEARSALPGYVMTGQPILAWPEARFAGEAVAAVVARDRYAAEDAAALVSVDWEPLPAALGLVEAARAGVAVHAGAPGNVLLARRFESGRVDEALAEAA
ncbi:MAG TPA: xanthine dehydrogenase family protein molybdopterin-binding subunit, partial [Methylomirabilota bacterium]|nr:xanthine dehydrogenase family protein molybdopterin-binding subunit [Methylomirabilota bacterium]